MKTARVQWLLEHIGELAGDDLKEAEMIKQFYEISDDEPVEQDRKEHQERPDPAFTHQSSRVWDNEPARGKLGDFDVAPGTHVGVVFGDPPPAPVERLEGIAALEERLSMMEATVKDLYAKIKALEARLDVGKTV
jgi:hypothetical protein